MARIKKELNVSSKDSDIFNSIEDQISLIDDLTKVLRKQNPNSAFNLEQDEVGTVVNDFISTGSSILDTKISNRPDAGGWPVGRVNELIGWEASGKTLVGIHGMIDTQKKGGIPIYLDTEQRVSKAFMKLLGLDLGRMIYSPLVTVEDVFATIDKVINQIMETQLERRREDRKIIFAVWDSVAMSSTIAELEKGYDEAGMADKARIIGRCLRKSANLLAAANTCLLCLNQLREKIGVMYGPKETTPGGNAIKYQSTVRVLLRKAGAIHVGTGKDKTVIGQEAHAKIIKNTVSGEGRECNFEIYHNSGIVENPQEIWEYFSQTDRVQMINRDRGNFIMPTGETVEFNRLKDWTDGLNLWKNNRDYILEHAKKAMIIDLSNPNLELSKEEDEESIRSKELFNALNNETI